MHQRVGNPSPAQRLLSGEQKVWLFTAFLGMVALALTVLLVRRLEVDFPHLELPFWAFVPVFVVAEAMIVQRYVGRSTQALSISETPLVVGLAFVDPLGLLVARTLGTLFMYTVHRPIARFKAGFNVVSAWLEAVVALWIWHAVLGGADPIAPRGWLAALVAVAAIDALATVTFVVVLTLHDGAWPGGSASRFFSQGLWAAVVNASFGVVIVTLLAADWRAVWAVGVMVAMLVVAYRAHATLRRTHAEVEHVHAFGQVVSASLDADHVARLLLERAADLLRAEVAELRLHDAPAGGRVIQWREGEIGDVALGAARSGRIQGPLLISAGDRADQGPFPASWGEVRELLAVPLWGREGNIVGELWVANRLDEVSTFTVRDVKLLATLANQAAVALDNSRLVGELRDQADASWWAARHDSLTGLVNRGCFQERIGAVLDRNHTATVMLLDLDRFKEVNDTLGHRAGDQLLCQVAERLRRAAPSGALVGRLGGDEFAILLDSVSEPEDAEVAARTVLATFRQPFDVEGIAVDIVASLGLVLSPAHGDDPETLLQRADVAMYQAKEGDGDLEIYAPARDRNSARRLAMMAELRRAIEASDLAVHFQPLVALPSGDVHGVEALVRWHHPEHGPIGPDEFIPLAEQTGLIRPLTESVLRTALRQCRRWQEQGLSIEMAVNVSSTSLLDTRFPDLVAALLVQAGVAPEMLTLELTETDVLQDSARAAEILQRLAGMGVRLAIDDFGTGYSSLARVKNLPVDQLKIDRSFVSRMLVDGRDHAIVRSTLDLARNLGLLVVAEGIEDAATAQRLTELGCQFGQGYWFSRPMPAEDLTLARGPARTAGVGSAS